jgi:hypothetical protein
MSSWISGKPRKVSEGTLSKLMSVLHSIVEQKRNGTFPPFEAKIPEAPSTEEITS